MELFPDIGLDQSKFNFQQSIKLIIIGCLISKYLQCCLEYWHRLVNRRKFFENYAKEQGFDPLVPENWYSQPIQNLMELKVYNLFVFVFIIFRFILFSCSYLIIILGFSACCILSQK